MFAAPIIPARMESPPCKHLPRLERERYQAFAVVHWTMTVENRATGWLDAHFHARFRELLLHAAAREHLLCPAYCLMPDHAHLIWMGLGLKSDQLTGMKFLREQLNRELEATDLRQQAGTDATDLRRQTRTTATDLRRRLRLQKQAYDHVLREEERQRDAFAKTCFYIMENPARAGLVARAQDHPFSGAIVPGYPTLHPLQPDYWEKFWPLYWQMRESTPGV